ncbi:MULTISPECIES: HAD family hydrolase [unclassified Enterococcus]|uniref:HAD family hydrolase n=1 Tax=unclassified Enterococcus TaxID=2608891 RepID=UPI001CE1D995|nr:MULTISPECIES: HAD family hydrolase [unclassified Enterococcus]MCA5011464.1 HAD family hydrolase [Enterococcus sp. S23]MCA5015094.1 HAD family hydrolase [Enterococcus sp. S22(2020)]
MSYEYVIFDFDGTLGDSKECGFKATEEAFKKMGLTIPKKETIEYYMGIPIEKSFKKMSNRALSQNEFDELLGLFRTSYKEYENDYLKIFPGIKELLATLKTHKKMMFVVSSKKTDVLKRNLESLTISDYFTEIVGSDKVSNYKPDPEGIHYLLKKYSMNPVQTLMVGDAVFDIQMGKAAEVGTCGVTWGSHAKVELAKERPDLLIDEPKELLSWIG